MLARLRDGGDGSDGEVRVTSGFSGSGCCGGGAGGSENRFFASVRNDREPPLTWGGLDTSRAGNFSASLIFSFDKSAPKKWSALPRSLVCNRAALISLYYACQFSS